MKSSRHVYWSVCVSENGDGGGCTVGAAGVVTAPRCAGEDATTADVKCTSLVARTDHDSASTPCLTTAAAALTSGHVTATEHDHMVSSTIHSDGTPCTPSLYLSTVSSVNHHSSRRWRIVTFSLHSQSSSFRTAFTELNLYWIKGALAFVCFSFFFIFFLTTCARLSWILSFWVHVKLLYRIV